LWCLTFHLLFHQPTSNCRHNISVLSNNCLIAIWKLRIAQAPSLVSPPPPRGRRHCFVRCFDKPLMCSALYATPSTRGSFFYCFDMCWLSTTESIHNYVQPIELERNVTKMCISFSRNRSFRIALAIEVLVIESQFHCMLMANSISKLSLLSCYLGLVLIWISLELQYSNTYYPLLRFVVG
jgi:hypothetical protein